MKVDLSNYLPRLAGFVAGAGIVAALNVRSWLESDWCRRVSDCGWTFGFPFEMYRAGTILHLDDIDWSGVAGNAIAAVAMGVVFAAIVGRVSTSRFR